MKFLPKIVPQKDDTVQTLSDNLFKVMEDTIEQDNNNKNATATTTSGGLPKQQTKIGYALLFLASIIAVAFYLFF